MFMILGRINEKYFLTIGEIGSMVKIRKKQLLSITFLLSVLFLLAACGKSETPDQTSSKADDSEPAALQSPETISQTATEIAAVAEQVVAVVEEKAEAVSDATAVNIESKEHIVYAQATSFDPKILFINPGDTVQWTNMSPTHDSVSIDGLIPEGAEPWKFALGANGSVTLAVEGVYVYKCTPHYAVGMTGAIIVGEASNMEQIKTNVTGRAKGMVIKVERALAKK